MKKKRRRHFVFEIPVASMDDERLRDRYYFSAGRGIMTFKLPVRRNYIIEATNAKAAQRKAVRMAIDDEIPHPISMGMSNLTLIAENDRPIPNGDGAGTN